jgi:hypothetical protein
MADCECLPGCPFFNDRMAKMPAMADVYKKKYCKGDNSKCARYMVRTALGAQSVPTSLFPNQHEDAKQFIATHR